MSRTKEFDEAEVLDRALELFRAHGYQQTSFSDLTTQLGVSRQSLYDTYGDKHALFHAALQSYVNRALDFIQRRLDDPAPVRSVFQGLFDDLTVFACSGGSPGCSKGFPGCLMVNSMVELAPSDDATRALALNHARSIEGLFASRLSLAQRQGELSKDKDPVALARYLYHTLLGLSVATRALGERDSLRQTVQIALQALS